MVASLLAFLAIFAIWANRQLLNTDNWAETSSQLIENDDIRTQVSAFVVDELYANVDVKSDLEQIFEQVLEPERAAVLAGPAAGGLRTLAENGVNRLLQRPVPQQLWEQANRRAQARFLQIVEGGGDVVSTSGGEVTLDLKSLLGQTQSNLGVGGRVEQKLPADASQIVILQSDQLELAQDAVRLLKTLAVVFVVLSLALFVLAIYLARAGAGRPLPPASGCCSPERALWWHERSPATRWWTPSPPPMPCGRRWRPPGASAPR